MNKNLLIGLGVFLAVVIAGFLFLRKPQVASNGMPVPGSNVNEKTVTDTGSAKEIKVSAKEFSFTPSTISVKKGETVKITLTNDGTTAHDFSIPDLGISTKVINPGESDSIEFTANEAGTFGFICSVDSHKDLGLTGTLEVK